MGVITMIVSVDDAFLTAIHNVVCFVLNIIFHVPVLSCTVLLVALCSLCLRSQGVIQPLVNVKHEYASFRADLVEQWSDMQQMVGSLAPAMQRLVDGNQRLASQYVRARAVCAVFALVFCAVSWHDEWCLCGMIGRLAFDWKSCLLVGHSSIQMYLFALFSSLIHCLY
jgi:hypothetical protein